jgi:hypothetical protein
MMKKILILIVFGAAGYWGWTQYGAQMGANPVYADFRVKYSNGVELVGIGRMDSQGDCERRADEFWRRTLAVESGTEISSVRCDKQLAARYEGLFSNRVIHATYIALDRGNSGERDGRFIVYGVPSSEVGKVCPTLIGIIKRTYSGKVECIQGTVG